MRKEAHRDIYTLILLVERRASLAGSTIVASEMSSGRVEREPNGKKEEGKVSQLS